MICAHPGCTGVHDNNRYHELCPAALYRKAVKDARWVRNHPDKVFLKNDRQAQRRRLQWLEDMGIDIRQLIEEGD